MSAEPKDKLIVALDVDTLGQAERLVKALSGSVGAFKIGKELFTSEGPRAVEAVHRAGGKVFLDLKYHDIPNTVGGACSAAARLGVFMANVHASGGRAMMTEAVRRVREAPVQKRPLLIGVTVLTSMAESDLAEVGVSKGLEDQVGDLAALSADCGLDGVVASAKEIAIIRKRVPGRFLIVTPGVRPAWAASGDQKRVLTPAEAVGLGADYIVVGRPITASTDPRQAAEKIVEEIRR